MTKPENKERSSLVAAFNQAYEKMCEVSDKVAKGKFSPASAQILAKQYIESDLQYYSPDFWGLRRKGMRDPVSFAKEMHARLLKIQSDIEAGKWNSAAKYFLELGELFVITAADDEWERMGKNYQRLGKLLQRLQS